MAPILGRRFPFLTFFLAMFVVSWRCGFGPGILATLVSWLAIDWFVIGPFGPVPISGERWQLATALGVVGVSLAALGEALRSARRRAEAGELASLRARHAHFQALFDQAAVGIAELDFSGRFLSANDRYCEIVGYPREELLALRFQEITHPDDPPANLRNFERLADDPTSYAVEKRYVRKDGRTVWARVAVSLVRDAEGRPAGILAVAEDITSRTELAAQLEAERGLLDAFFASTTVGLGLIDTGFRYVRVNQALAETNGIPIADHLGRTVHEVLPKLWPSLKPLFERVLLTGEPLKNFEVAGETAKGVPGGQSWIINYYPVRQDGRVVGIGFAVVETTEARRQQALLREAEERLRLAVEVTGLGIWDSDGTFENVSWSPRMKAIFGLSPDVIITPAQIAPMIHPEDLPAFRQANNVALNPSGDGRLEIEHRIVRADGEVRWVALHGQCSFVGGPGDRWPERFIGTALDITGRREGEEAVRQSAGQLRLLWEAASVLLSTDDPDRMMRGLFAKLAPHFGLDAYFNFGVDESGEALRLVSCVGVDERAVDSIRHLAFGQAVCGNVALRRAAIVAEHIQASDEPMVAVAKSLGLRAYACNPLLAGDTLLGTLSFSTRRRDSFRPDELEFLATVSHYVAFAYERLRLIGQLREADRRKDLFLATLAHELRNPLAPIRNALHLMGHAGASDVEAERSMAERQVAHLSHLVDDLLDVARINRGKIELRSRPVELSAVVRQAATSARASFEARGLAFDVRIPDGPIPMQADPTRLEQILDNLLTNACKYTDSGGSVSLDVEPVDGQAAIRVRDTGIGIPAEQLPRIFEMFAQVDQHAHRAQGGLGIGLGLVKTLVELHGGSISARSEGIGKGSEFTVRLPIRHVAPLPAAAPSPATNGSAGPTRRRVLVVDDNVDAAKSLARLLTRVHGHEVQVAHDGPAALDLVPGFRPEVVILDIGMPGMDGYELARNLRSRPETAPARLIALSGWGQDDHLRRSRDAGIDRHIVKPIDPATLADLV